MTPHQTTAREKRREARRVATGKVRVSFEFSEIDGKLMDLSASGFRMSHHFTALHSGQIVEFSHVEASGKARVMWNRILAGGVETGFLVVSGEEQS